MSLRSAAIFASASLLLLAGCANDHRFAGTNATTLPTAYTGPTDPLDVVLAKINTNNKRITTLVCSGTFEGTFGPEQRTLNGQVFIQHTKPDKLWLRLNKDIASEILIAGTNGTQFWLSAFGDIDTTWYGTTNGAAAADQRLLVSPTLIADVLGVATLNLDMRAEPVPTMRFNPDYDVYMLTWSTSTPDRWVTVREVWYDRATLQPRRIWLFDRDGRVTVRAKLGDARPMDGAGETGPVVARKYQLFFPEQKSRLTLGFDEVRATRGKAPNEQLYRFDPTRVRTSKVENLDDAGAAAK